MIIIIPCSGQKNLTPPTIFNKREIHFQAVEIAEKNIFTPWSVVPGARNKTFIDLIQEEDLNAFSPASLCPAGELYAPGVYGDVRKWCSDHGHSLYILSAGWGLVAAETRIPVYDVTFSNAAPSSARITVRNRSICPAIQQCADVNALTHLFLPAKYLEYYMSLSGRPENEFVHWGENLGAELLDQLKIPEDHQVFENVNRAKTNWHYNAIRGFIGP